MSSGTASRLITLLTDFGDVDPFVGIMKGVIKGIYPNADIIDLTHGIPPQQILPGAVAWQTAAPYFPDGTIHVGVVDPGVGTSRRAIAIETTRAIFICPDNGLATYIAYDDDVKRVVAIGNERYLLPSRSRSFHGRDIFAPAAAHIAAGVDLDELGPRLSNIVRLPPTEPAIANDTIVAHIVYFDTFGNAYTDLTEANFEAWGGDRVRITVGGHEMGGIVDAYGTVEPGHAAALFASHGRLEIAIRNSSARSIMGLNIGDEVRVDRA